MIRITDITISVIEKYNPSPEQLRNLVDYLISVGVDFIELTIPSYKKIRELNPKGKYALRIDSPLDMDDYFEFGKFVVKKSGNIFKSNITTEIQANDIREINMLSQYGNLQNVRIVGFDDIMNHDYITAFSNLRKKVSGRIELCPENRFFSATAIAVEWIFFGESDIACSFAGVGSKAALEEVMMALRLEKRHKNSVDFSNFSKLKCLIEEITGEKIPRNKAVIGDDIFNIESGIHANGISKAPKLYEPFNPELVGNERKLILGKHSGNTAIILKLKELNLPDNSVDISILLTLVHEKSIEICASITDEMFIEIYKKAKKGSA